MKKKSNRVRVRQDLAISDQHLTDDSLPFLMSLLLNSCAKTNVMQELIRPKRPLLNDMLMAGLDSISKERSSSPPVSRCDGETVIQYVKTVNMDPMCD